MQTHAAARLVQSDWASALKYLFVDIIEPVAALVIPVVNEVRPVVGLLWLVVNNSRPVAALLWLVVNQFSPVAGWMQPSANQFWAFETLLCKYAVSLNILKCVPEGTIFAYQALFLSIMHKLNSRRKFLQNVSMSAIGFSVINHKSSFMQNSILTNPDDKILRVAILGLGGYATRVAEAMKSSTRAKLVGVISGTPSKIKDWQSRYNIPGKNCYNYENYDAIKDNDDIDAVYVITPNALHHDAVIRVAKAGKHAICEKPMSINAQQGQEMVDACKKANVKLLVGYRMHFEPHTLEIIRMRKAGELGKITFFQGLSGFVIGDPTQWRLNKALSGGGSLMDIGIYSINGARYMIGEEPVWLTAQETKTDKIKFKEGIDETLQIEMGFASGAVANILSTYNMDNLDRFFLNGSEGFAEMWPSTGYGPIRGKTNKGEIKQPDTIHQAVQMDEMAAIIFDNKQPVVPVDGEEAVKDLKIMDAVYKAAATGSKIAL